MKAFNWVNPYPSTRIPVFARNVVSTSHPLAAQAGLRMLLKGGNAVDAAIAAAATIVLVEPVSCGLGGDCFAIVWDGRQLHGLNSSGGAGGVECGVFQAQVRHRPGRAGRAAKRGWDAVTVPGVVAGWAALHEKLGKLPFEQLFEPAIEIAERGYTVPPVVAHKWAAAAAELGEQPGYARRSCPRGARRGWASISSSPTPRTRCDASPPRADATSTRASWPSASPRSARNAAAP